MIASIRAEWRKNLRRPSLLIAAVALAAVVVLVYGIDYYQAWHPSARQAAEAALLRLELYPRELVNNLVGAGFPLGAAVAIVLGAIATGSDFAWGTLKTSLVQQPGRLAVLAGRVIAFEVWMGLLTAILFGVGAVCSVVIAFADGQALMGPPIADVAGGVGAVWLVLGCYSALGMALGVVLRQAAAAVGVGLIYLLLLQVILVRFVSGAGDGTVRWLASLFDGQNASALLQSFTSPAFGPATLPAVGAGHAVVVLGLYLAAFVAASATFLARRDVA